MTIKAGQMTSVMGSQYSIFSCGNGWWILIPSVRQPQMFS